MKTRLLLALLAVSTLSPAQITAPAPGNVALPLDEYNQLVEKAAHPPKKADTPPAPYVLKSADLKFQVKAESVSGTILLDGDVLAKGDRKVPLTSGLIVTNAQQNGRDLPIEQQAGTHSAVFSGPGNFGVTLQAALPLTIDPGRASFNLPVPAAGTARLTLDVPGEQTQVNLTPGLITNRSSQGGRTTIEATLVPGQSTNIWWASRLAPVEPPAPKEIRFLSDIKTLISVTDADLSIAALAEISVVQGDPAQFELTAPEGYELTGATGSTLLSSDVQKSSIILRVADPAARSHQFLISLTKSTTASKAEIPLVTFKNSQRETGEVLVEGTGAMELVATEKGGLRRMDLKEVSPYLRSLSSTTLHTAFRYQKHVSETPAVAIDWTRFPDSRVLSAVAQQASATTLVTTEGRSLTEIKLLIRNKAQPFLRVQLPAGATILSADVAGEKVKPVEGSDGNRVPLLRPGFRPTDAYEISFVFLHAGTPFAKKGGADLVLPKMDIPIGRLDWEVFLPKSYRVTNFGGDVTSALLFTQFPVDANEELGRQAGVDAIQAISVQTSNYAAEFGQAAGGYFNFTMKSADSMGGIITDQAGAVVPGVNVKLTHLGTGRTWNVQADAMGRWSTEVPAGRVQISISQTGFKRITQIINHVSNRNELIGTKLEVGGSAETITVQGQESSGPPFRNDSVKQADNLPVLTLGQTGGFGAIRSPLQTTNLVPGTQAPADTSAFFGGFNSVVRINGLPSNTETVRVQGQDATNGVWLSDLQRRVPGVLPIVVNVPRTGHAYEFIRPLVVDEETKLTFTYNRGK